MKIKIKFICIIFFILLITQLCKERITSLSQSHQMASLIGFAEPMFHFVQSHFVESVGTLSLLRYLKAIKEGVWGNHRFPQLHNCVIKKIENRRFPLL